MDASSKNIVTAVFIGAYMLLLIVLRPFCSLKIMVRFVAVAASRGGSKPSVCIRDSVCVFSCVRMCAGCFLACRNYWDCGYPIDSGRPLSQSAGRDRLNLQILYQIMNAICLYSVVLSEVVAQAGNSSADYASFFSVASVLIIVIMMVYIWYFDFWSSGLLQEYVFQPVVNKVKAVVFGIHAEESSSAVAPEAPATGEGTALFSISTAPAPLHARHDAEPAVDMRPEQHGIERMFEWSDTLRPKPPEAWNEDQQIKDDEDDDRHGGMEPGPLPLPGAPKAEDLFVASCTESCASLGPPDSSTHEKGAFSYPEQGRPSNSLFDTPD